MTGNRYLDCASALERYRPEVLSAAALVENGLGMRRVLLHRSRSGLKDKWRPPCRGPSSSPSRSQWMPLIAAAVKIESGDGRYAGAGCSRRSGRTDGQGAKAAPSFSTAASCGCRYLQPPPPSNSDRGGVTSKMPLPFVRAPAQHRSWPSKTLRCRCRGNLIKGWFTRSRGRTCRRRLSAHKRSMARGTNDELNSDFRRACGLGSVDRASIGLA